MSVKQQELEQKIEGLRKVFDDNPGTKIKAIRQDLSNSLDEITRIFAEYREDIKRLHDEDLKSKMLEIEDKAAKKIVERIEEMDVRKKEEIENAKKFAMEKSASEAINVIDQLEIAVSFAQKDPAVKNYVSGFKIVLDMFIKWLNQFNITKIEVTPGEAFDEKRMSALEKVPSNLAKNCVVEVKKSGYMMHDKVIRHASVAVSDGTAAQAQPNPAPAATTTPPPASAQPAPAAATQQQLRPATPQPQQVLTPTTVINATQHISTSQIKTAAEGAPATPNPAIKK